MKKKITIATFISNNEAKNKDFDNLCKLLSKSYDVDVYIYSDRKIDTSFNNVVKKETKYFRIIDLIERVKEKDILFVDNDIMIDKENILKFVDEVADIDYGLAWGIIRTSQQKNFVEKLIDIDKLKSHYIIRPISWELNFGISLPGQVFMLNKDYYINNMPKINTLYDDLEIGAIAKENNIPVKYTKYILGYEKPKSTVKQLVAQRKRWAQGLAQIIHINRKTKVNKYVIIHGLIFNMLWLPVDILLILTGIYNIYAFCALLLLLSFWYNNFSIRKLLYAICYILLFWIIYVIWLSNIIKYLIIERKKYGN